MAERIRDMMVQKNLWENVYADIVKMAALQWKQFRRLDAEIEEKGITEDEPVWREVFQWWEDYKEELIDLGLTDVPIPDPPPELDYHGRRCWRRHYVGMLHDGTWRPTFKDALASMCRTYQDLMEARREIDSLKIEGQRGGDKLNPLVRERDQLEKQYNKKLSKMGLTTASRNNIPTEGLDGNGEDDTTSGIEDDLDL